MPQVGYLPVMPRRSPPTTTPTDQPKDTHRAPSGGAVHPSSRSSGRASSKPRSPRAGKAQAGPAGQEPPSGAPGRAGRPAGMLAGILAGLTRRLPTAQQVAPAPVAPQVLGDDLVAGAAGRGGSEFVGAYEQEGDRAGEVRAHERAARLSLTYFAQKVLTGRFLVGDFHREWEQLIQQYTRICILAPRDHGKSHTFSLAYPLWRAYQHRPISGGRGQIYILSATAEQAGEKLDLVRQELESNPQLKHLVPPGDRKRAWSRYNLQLANNYWIRARGFGVRIRGGHPQDIVVDDGINDETIYSPTTRQRQIDYFFSAISNMVTPGGRIIVVGCVPLDTWVATDQGLQQIGVLCPGELKAGSLHPLELGLLGRSGLQKAQYYWVQGETQVKRVTLEFGYRLTGSYRHPFLVMGEDSVPCWRRADALRVGDYVAVKSGMNSWGPDVLVEHPPERRWGVNKLDLPSHLTADLAYLIGLWTAEGSYEKTGRVAISTTEPELRAWLLSSPFGLKFKENTTAGSRQTLRASSKTFLRVLGALGAVLGTAERKHVPTRVMGAPRTAARAFLQGLFDGDGCASEGGSGGGHVVMLGTTSERLAREVQLLLLNFGILASLSKRPPAKPTKKAPGGGRFPLWVLQMAGGEACRFARDVGFRLARKQEIAQRFLESGKSRVRGLPLQAEAVRLARLEKPRRPRSPQLNPPPLNIGGVLDCRRPARRLLQQTADWFTRWGSGGEGVDRLRANLAEPDLMWMRVKSVEDDQAFTADFVLGGDHSFIGNGVVCHNTPFTATDLYSALKKTPAYTCREYPALRSVPGPQGQQVEVALFPERYTVAQLRWKRDREIGPIRFAREFQVQALADDLSLFPSRLFVGDPVEQPMVRLGMPLRYWRERGIVSVFQGVDFGLSATIGSDYTVIFTIGLDAYGNRWLLEIRRERGLSYQEQLSLLNEQGRLYQPGLMLLEGNQAQRIFGDELIRTTDLPIKLHHTGVEKHALEKGVPSIRILLENRKYRIPRGDERSVELTNQWQHEMSALTLQEGKVVSLADHDDLPMSNWLCELAISAGVFSFSMGLETMGPGMRPEDVALAAAGLAGQIPPGSQVVQGVPLLGGQQGVVIGQPAPQRWASSQPPPPPPVVGKSLWELQQGWGVPAGGMPPTLVADQTAVKKPE